MTYVSLDEIIKGVLLRKSYPLHYYTKYMISGRDIIRELTYDDGLQPPNTVLLNVDEYGSAALPCDFIDVIQVGVRVGQFIKPLVEKANINPLPNRDDGNLGEKSLYSNEGSSGIPFGYIPGMYWHTSYFNDYGEFLGRQNIGAGVQNDVYKVLPDQCRIQFSQNFANCKVVLIYLSNGCGCSTTMGVSPLARSVIEAYMAYDRLRNTRNASLGERQLAEEAYVNERRKFRARKNTLTVDGIRRLMQQAYYIAPKV